MLLGRAWLGQSWGVTWELSEARPPGSPRALSPTLLVGGGKDRQQGRRWKQAVSPGLFSSLRKRQLPGVLKGQGGSESQSQEAEAVPSGCLPG